jgi:hypothetical protein
MRKLLVLCLIVFLVSCKDKDKEAGVDPDYAPGFVGSYSTSTVDGNETTIQNWDITTTDKNLLAINYTKTTKVATSGTTVEFVQIYPLVDVKVKGEDTFTINEVVDVQQTTSTPLRQRVEGEAKKVTNSAGNAQLDITIKYTNSATGESYDKYLEFKKK